MKQMHFKKTILPFLMVIIAINCSCKSNEPDSTQQNKVLSLNFNNNTNDLGSHKNTMIVNNITFVKDSLGNVDGAAYFDGTSSFITSASNNSFDLKTSFTFSIWIKPETSNGNLVEKAMDMNGGGPYSFDYIGGRPRILLYFSYSEYFLLTGNTPVALNKWQYLAATWDGNSVKLYVNGQLDNESTLKNKIIMSSSKGLGIGIYQWNPSGMRYKGSMDNLEIYNTALSQTEIENKYSQYK